LKEIAYRLCHVRWRQELGSPSYLHAFGRKEAVFETLFCQECYKVSKIRKTQARQNDGYAWLVRAFLILMARGVAEVGGGGTRFVAPTVHRVLGRGHTAFMIYETKVLIVFGA